MGLPLFIEPGQRKLEKSSTSEKWTSCSEVSCHRSRFQRSCQHLVALTWVANWYDPWRSLRDTIKSCLGHNDFAYWGVWTAFADTGRSGVFEMILRIRHPRLKFGADDVSSLSKPNNRDSQFRLEQCFANRFSCCSEASIRPLYEIDLALLQPLSFQVGDEWLRAGLRTNCLEAGRSGFQDGLSLVHI